MFIDCEKDVAWIEYDLMERTTVVNVVAGLPGPKKYKRGMPFFGISRQNLEYLETRLPNAKWHDRLREKLDEYARLRQQEQQVRLLRREDLEAVSSVLEPSYKLPPYAHQRRALALSRGREAFGYFMEQGCGKTKTTLDDAAWLYVNGGEKGKIDTLIIIAPNGVHKQWILKELPKNMSPDVPYEGAYSSSDPSLWESVRWKEVSKLEKGLRVFAFHIEGLSSGTQTKKLEEILRHSSAMLVVDESTSIKTPTSKRTQTLIALGGLAKYRRILTGTPVTQGAEDLFSQLNFLSSDILGLENFFAFKSTYCLKGGFEGRKIVGYKNLDSLTEKMDNYTFRVRKEDCLDLPPKIMLQRLVPLPPETLEQYKKLRKEFFVELESGVMTVKMAMTRVMRLQQMLGGAIHQREKKDKTGAIVVPEIYEEFATYRPDHVLQILEQTATEDKALIWLRYESDYRILARHLDKSGLVWLPYTGLQSSEDRDRNLDKFRSDKKIKALILSLATGSEGLDIPQASEVIHYSRSWSYKTEQQANDRCHRIGQTKPVNYHYLLTPNTVDEKIDSVLTAKQDVATTIVDLRRLLDE